MSRAFKWPFVGELKVVNRVLTPNELLALDTVPIRYITSDSDSDIILPLFYGLFKPPGAVYATTANLILETTTGTSFGSFALNSAAVMDLTSALKHAYGNRPAAGTITNALSGLSLQLRASGAITGSGNLPTLTFRTIYAQMNPYWWLQQNV